MLGDAAVPEPAFRALRVRVLHRFARLGYRHGLGVHIHLEMDAALVSRIRAGHGIPGAHTAVIVAAGRVGNQVVIPVGAVRIGGCLFEPDVVAAGMIQYEVEIDADIPGLRFRNQVLQVVFRAQFRTDGSIIVHIVAVVRHGLVDRREPERGGSDAVEIIEVLRDAADVAPAVTVAVGETIDVDLVGDTRELLRGSLVSPGLIRSAGNVRPVRPRLDLGACGQQQGRQDQCRNREKPFHTRTIVTFKDNEKNYHYQIRCPGLLSRPGHRMHIGNSYLTTVIFSVSKL